MASTPYFVAMTAFTGNAHANFAAVFDVGADSTMEGLYSAAFKALAQHYGLSADRLTVMSFYAEPNALPAPDTAAR